MNNPSFLVLSSQERYFSPLSIFLACLWTHSNSFISFLCWGHLDAKLQVGSHHSRVEGDHPLPFPAFDVVQNTWLFGLPVPIDRSHPAFCQPISPSPFPQGCCQIILHHPIFICGINLSHVQDLVLLFVELNEVCTSQMCQDPSLDGIISSLQCVDCTTLLGVVGTPAEGALNPTVTERAVKQHWSQWQLLKNTIHPMFWEHSV